MLVPTTSAGSPKTTHVVAAQEVVTRNATAPPGGVKHKRAARAGGRSGKGAEKREGTTFPSFAILKERGKPRAWPAESVPSAPILFARPRPTVHNGGVNASQF